MASADKDDIIALEGASEASAGTSAATAGVSVPASEVSIEGKTKGKIRRSSIYIHFTENPATKKWRCNYCRKEYKTPAGGGTGSMVNHMKQTHPSKLVKDLQTRIEKYGELVVKEKPEPELKQITKEEFLQKLVKFIVCSDQPFSLVEESAFEDLIKSIQNADSESALTLPGRTALKDLICKQYSVMKDNLEEALKNTPSRLNFVIDCWSSSNGHSYQGVIVSWIDSDWKMNTTVLDLTRITGSHTGDNLAKHFLQVLDDFKIWNKLLSVTTDNAGNMGTLFKELDRESIKRSKPQGELVEVTSSQNPDTSKGDSEPVFNSKDSRIRCLAHIINLCCKAVLKILDSSIAKTNVDESDESEIDENEDEQPPPGVISKVRRAVKKIRNSQEKRDFLRKQCTVANIKAQELILDMPVRWNSTLNMIERAKKLQGPLTLTLSNFRDIQNLQLCQDEWEKLDDLIEFLMPFRDATLLFSQNKPLLSSTLHIYEILFSHLERYLPEDTTKTSYRGRRRNPRNESWLNTAAEAGFEKLKKYYPSADGLAYKVATILDPRRKDKWYTVVNWSPEWIKACKADVRRLWTSKYKPNTQRDENSDSDLGQPPAKRVRNFVEDMIDIQMSTIPRGVQEDELTKYLKETVADKDTDILKWWKLRQHEYPNLSRMARDYLSIFGTGVPVERLFSSATDTLTHRRYRMTPSTINQCLCLKSWYKLTNSNEIYLELGEALKEKVLGKCDNDDCGMDQAEICNAGTNESCDVL